MKDFIILNSYGKESSAIRKNSIDAFFISDEDPRRLVVWVNGCIYNAYHENSEKCEKMFQLLKKELSN